MRHVVALLAGLTLAGTAACTSTSDSYTAPSGIGGSAATEAKGGKGSGPAAAGSAVATGAITGSFDGTFDSGGNFSGSGTFTFDLRNTIAVVSDHGNPADCGGGLSTTSGASFSTLSGTGGDLLQMRSGDTMIKSVRFSGLTSTSSSPSSCGLHFRGNAILDEVTEMSRMAVACTADDGTTCTSWTMEACPSNVVQCGPNDIPAEGAVGQLYGQFSKRIGFQPMARYLMPWSLTITKN